MQIRARVTIGSLAFLLVLWSGCFTGAERDKNAPPGVPGGKCLAPDPSVGGSMPTCSAGTCNLTKNFCYDTTDPCRGFFCGGEDRGTCVVDNAQPSCVCAPGFNNDAFSHYCCPDDGSEPSCLASTVSAGGEESTSAGESGSSSGG